MLKAGRNSRTKKTVGIDIGASKIDWAVLESSGVESSGKVEIDETIGERSLMDIIYKIIYESDAKLAGISVAGFVRENKIFKMPNLPKISNFEIEAHIPVFVQNDLKCAALAVWWRRGRKTDDSFVLVSPGSGIGGAIVQNGKLVLGEKNLAGEFGHMKIPFDGARGSPKLVDWESLAGGKGIKAQLSALVRGRLSISSKKYKFESAKEIFESDTPLAKRVCSKAAFYFGMGLGNIANALNPKEIVLTGSVSKAYLGKYKINMREAFEKAAIEPIKKTKISASKFENPALLGSILLTRQKNNKKVKEFFSL